MIFDPNELFFKMADLLANKDADSKLIIANEGGSRCFDANTIVSTLRGNIPISEIAINDKALSYNHSTNKIEYKNVESVIITENNTKPCFKIKLKNGSEINCTQDHKFYFNGRYIEAKNIVSLWNERNNRL